jgi:hypothetical protein
MLIPFVSTPETPQIISIVLEVWSFKSKELAMRSNAMVN